MELAAEHLVALFGANEENEDAFVGALLVAEFFALVRSLGEKK